METSDLRINKNTNKGCKIAAHFYHSLFSVNLGLIIFNHYCQSSQDFYGIGATIRIGRQMLCVPYAGFYLPLHTRDTEFLDMCC